MIYLLEMPPITGMQLLIALLVLAAIVIGVILFMRNRFNSLSQTDLTGLHQGRDKKSPLDGRNKYREVDAFRYSGTLLNFGFLAALLIAILAFSWTQYDSEVFIPDNALELDDDIEIEPPRTAEPPPPPPPPPPPVIQEVPEEEVTEPPPKQVSQEIVNDDPVEAPPEVKEVPKEKPKPKPKPKEKVPDEIFQVVEEMPRFPGCESEGDKEAQKKCASDKMIKFIYGNIKYPPIARENGVEGTVVIRFVVDKDGSVTAPEIVRDIGAQCGAEALRVVNMMPKWIPGKQRGQAVKVYFNLPVKFRLE